LFFCEDDLLSYDTNLKVNPPLRTKKDRDALRNGTKNGIIDFIASHHQPQNWDNKVCEFEYAKNGMEGLESVFGAARVCGVSTDQFVKMQTENIRGIFKIEEILFEKGKKAGITLFNPDAECVFEEKDIFSKSKNNAFIGKKLKGRVIGIINGDKLLLK
jgi:dihydroorotase